MLIYYKDAKEVAQLSYFSFVWEIFVNTVEAFLFLYLLSRHLERNHTHSFYIAGIIIRIIWISFLNIFIIDTTLSLILLLFYDVLLTYLLFKGNKAKKFLWGCSYVVIAIIADKLTFFIADKFTDYQLQDLIIAGKIRIIMSLVYLLTCTMLVFVLSYHRKKDIFLPIRFRIMLLLLVCLGIIASDQLLNVIIYFDLAENHDILTTRLESHLEIISYIILIIIFGFIIFIEYLGFVSQQNEELRKEATLNELKKEHYETINTTISALRAWKHDYLTHLQIILNLTQNQQYTELENYIGAIEEQLINTTQFVTTGNQILDALLSTKILEFQKYDIKFTYEIFIVSTLPFDNMTFAALIGNLLNNAFDACRNMKSNEPKYIDFCIKPFQSMLYIKVENSTDNHYLYNPDGTLRSTKSSSEHGIGLKTVGRIVGEAKGFYNIYPDEQKFTISIMLPIPN